MVMGTPGDRTDEIIRGVAEIAARGADQVVIGHKEHYLRGRDVEGLTALLREGASAVGVGDVPSYRTELDGMRALIDGSGAGDVVGVMCHAERTEIAAWLGAAGATVDSPARSAPRSSAASRSAGSMWRCTRGRPAHTPRPSWRR